MRCQDVAGSTKVHAPIGVLAGVDQSLCNSCNRVLDQETRKTCWSVRRGVAPSGGGPSRSWILSVDAPPKISIALSPIAELIIKLYFWQLAQSFLNSVNFILSWSPEQKYRIAGLLSIPSMDLMECIHRPPGDCPKGTGLCRLRNVALITSSGSLGIRGEINRFRS